MATILFHDISVRADPNYSFLWSKLTEKNTSMANHVRFNPFY